MVTDDQKYQLQQVKVGQSAPEQSRKNNSISIINDITESSSGYGSGYDVSNWELYQHLNSSLFISKSCIPPQFQIMTISFLLCFYKAFLHRCTLYIDLHPAGVQNRVSGFDLMFLVRPCRESRSTSKKNPTNLTTETVGWQLFPCRMKLMPPL